MLLGFDKDQCQIVTRASWKMTQEMMTSVKKRKLRPTCPSKCPFLEFPRAWFHCHLSIDGLCPVFALHNLPVSSESPPQMLGFFLPKSLCSHLVFFHPSLASSLPVLSRSSDLVHSIPPSSPHLALESTDWSKGLFGSIFCLELFSNDYRFLKRPQHSPSNSFPLILTTHSPSQPQFCSGNPSTLDFDACLLFSLGCLFYLLLKHSFLCTSQTFPPGILNWFHHLSPRFLPLFLLSWCPLALCCQEQCHVGIVWGELIEAGERVPFPVGICSPQCTWILMPSRLLLHEWICK